MRRALIPLAASILLLGLGACETGSTLTGAADYDSLRRATADCAAQGETLALKDGGDAQRIQDYACKRK
ncbi:MAG: hypothetical protein ACHP9T_04525 [Caulobacterales bacterium]|jgi:hypothetical protein